MDSDSRECHNLHEVVWVDKKSDEILTRIYQVNLKRYPVALHPSTAFDLQLVGLDASNTTVTKKYASDVKSTNTVYDHQYQPEILITLPAGAEVYASIDLGEAFTLVQLIAALQSLFCRVCHTTSGPTYVRWKSLLQGREWTSLFFRIEGGSVIGAESTVIGILPLRLVIMRATS